MKIVLAGSPSISVNTFEEVIKNFNVVAIVTQPDRPQGRGMKMQKTPVAELGEKYNIKIFKPEKIGDIFEQLKELDFDLLLSFAFGQFIPPRILELGKYKPLNIHGSILPKYRGAAPIQHAILNGDNEIGITLMEMIKEMDAGDIYATAKIQIDSSTNTSDAFKIVSELAEKNIVTWLKKYEQNILIPIPQGNKFTLSPKLSKEFCLIDNSLTKKQTIRKIKALAYSPGAFCFHENKRLKIFDASEKSLQGSIPINCLDGNIYATEYQYEGKKIVKLF